MLSYTITNVVKNLWPRTRITIFDQSKGFATTLMPYYHEEKQDLYDETEVVEPIISEYVEYQESSTDRMEFLQTLLQCSREQAKFCFSTNKFLKNCPRDIIRAKLDLLEYYGLHSDKVVAQPLLLSLSEASIPEKIEQINTLKYIESFDNFYPLMCVPHFTLNSFFRVAKVEHMKFGYPSRLHYLAKNLEVPVVTMCIKLSKFSFLTGISYERIHRMTTAMLENEMNKKHILKDLWVYRHNEHIFHDRLTLLRQHGVRNIKGWMMRTPEPTFQRYLLHHTSPVHNPEEVVQLLTTNFGFKEKVVRVWLANNPSVRRVNTMQLKDIVDYLKQVGYPHEDILSTPEIIKCNLYTVKTKIEELRQLGCCLPHLSVICCDIRTYSGLVSQLRQTQRHVRQH